MFEVEVFDVLFDLVRAGEVALGSLQMPSSAKEEAIR
jgi:hypothetical protein